MNLSIRKRSAPLEGRTLNRYIVSLLYPLFYTGPLRPEDIHFIDERYGETYVFLKSEDRRKAQLSSQ